MLARGDAGQLDLRLTETDLRQLLSRSADHAAARLAAAQVTCHIDVPIDVRDAGPGFPADFLPHAFERFRRPDAGRSRDGGGSGLGLAIVAAIATAHGGTATVRNGPGCGALVSLRLPGASR